jgi:hypothetical protein
MALSAWELSVSGETPWRRVHQSLFAIAAVNCAIPATFAGPQQTFLSTVFGLNWEAHALSHQSAGRR